ncbi:biotin synthase [Desulfonatronum thiosulfatophilum]|uniref:Biotin synthase n=1 Tax=Desulfonatronum thiosulfatophilum TaxID=617002 RepID=A0A1G6AKU8_9BACT|nr:radical SAM protein [Desulfonatronum thiosulfatophilum]SDB08989.1 biotin synthase [Desulfonatronum thiosulfatophilum]
MTMKLSPKVAEILRKSQDFEELDQEEIVFLLRLDLCSAETYAVMHAANALSRATFGTKGERHLHIGLNVEPCRFDCLFCSLTRTAGIFTEAVEFSIEQVLEWARNGQSKGADGMNIMTTGFYPFEKLLDMGRLLRREVRVPLVANTRDISHKEGEALLEAGFVGCYHAIRLGEGRDTPFSPEKRRQTIQVFKDVGLLWMNCIEPVGPEHSHEEIAGLMLLARRMGATYSGVMRRINFPGSPMEQHGMITEREMARMVAVSRLVMGNVPRAHCTHEPHTASLMAGANLFFPEVGSSPRDLQADSAKGRGSDLDACAAILREMNLDPLLPSNCFTAAPHAFSDKPAGCGGQVAE